MSIVIRGIYQASLPGNYRVKSCDAYNMCIESVKNYLDAEHYCVFVKGTMEQ